LTDRRTRDARFERREGRPQQEWLVPFIDDPAFKTLGGALHVAVAIIDDRAHVLLSGELDMSGAPHLDEVLEVPDVRSRREIVLDLRRLAFIDGAGVRSVLRARRSTRARGQTLTLLRGSPAVHRVFELTGADRRLSFGEPTATR
jgi:anti-anti-sigma factor